MKAWLNMSRLAKLNNQRFKFFIVNYSYYYDIIFYDKFLLLFHLTECKPSFELNSFHFGISVPVHTDTGEFHHCCKDAQMTSLQLILLGH